MKGIIRILRLNIEQADNHIFLFNFFTHSELIDFVKSYFLKSRIVFTIHYLDWTFLVKGNNRIFVNALNRLPLGKKTLLEKQVYDVFLQDKKTLEKVDHAICLSKYTKNLFPVIGQTHSEIEIILVDDGSDEEYDDIIQSFNDNR